MEPNRLLNGLVVGASLLSCVAACGPTSHLNVSIHMQTGSTRFECAEIARYSVLATRKVLAPTDGHDSVADDQRASNAEQAAIKEAAEQLPSNDPVRQQALTYVHGPRSPNYFAPCANEILLAQVGKLKVPSR